MLRVQEIDPKSAEYHQLCRFEGPLYENWCQKWDSLSFAEKDCCTHPVLVVSWLKNLSNRDSSETRLFVIREKDELVCALPAKIHPKKVAFATLYQLQIPYNPRLQQFGASIAIARHCLEPVLKALVRHFKDRGLRLCQINFPKVNETHFLVTDKLHKNTWHNGQRGVFRVDGDGGKLFARMSKRFRRNLRRIEKRLLRMPRVEYQCFAGDQDLVPAFERFVAVEASGWKKTERTAIKINRPLYGFYSDIASQLSKSGCLMIMLLSSDGADLAGQYCLKFEKTLFMFKIGYNEAFKALAPGLMLLKNTLTESVRAYGVDTVNLISYDQWQKRWSPDLVNTFEVELYPRSVLGLALKLYCRLPKEAILKSLIPWRR